MTAGYEGLPVGARLRAERERRGWTRAQMARRVRAQLIGTQVPDVDSIVSYLKRHEAGKTGISGRYRDAYAAALDLADLFGEQDGKQERVDLMITRPSRLDLTVVEDLAAILAVQRRLEDRIGPAALLVPMTTQMNAITAMLREASGPHRDELARVIAEWTVFTGWLHAAVRQDERALALFARAEDMADDISDGTIAATATSFRGYVARQQGRHRGVIRASHAALATPGAHPSQRTFDTLQAAQGYAGVGDAEQARRLLEDAADMADSTGDPPPIVYWYSTPFFRLNIGMVHLGVGQHHDAAEMLASGLEEMPADQREAEWTAEYRQALAEASQRS